MTILYKMDKNILLTVTFLYVKIRTHYVPQDTALKVETTPGVVYGSVNIKLLVIVDWYVMKTRDANLLNGVKNGKCVRFNLKNLQMRANMRIRSFAQK